MRSIPASRARVIWCTVKGTPATGSMGLGVFTVNGHDGFLGLLRAARLRSSGKGATLGHRPWPDNEAMSSTATDIRSAVFARTDPAQPYVTYLGSDGRMELSGASVINAAAKIANALTSEFDCD